MSFDHLSRRDLLKLLAIAPSAFFYRTASRYIDGSLSYPDHSIDKKNIIIILFDALSAINTTINGYRRATTPNLERFAERAFVYKSHYSPGNFTVPGTASLLTGLYPWTHQANNYGGKIADSFTDHNIFQFIGSDLYTTAYSQNPYADLLLYQFEEYIDFHVNNSRFNLIGNSLYSRYFSNDAVLAYQSVDGFSLRQNSGVPGAQILSTLNNIRMLYQNSYFENRYKKEYPLGLPFVIADVVEPYTLDDLFLGVINVLSDLPVPFFTYLHLYPPHGPYLPSQNFANIFADGWKMQEKPAGVFPDIFSNSHILERLQKYDEFLAAADDYFGILLSYFEKSGLFESSYIFITSDHGELFERGIYGHTNEYLYEPIIKIPLLISTPGQTKRVDVHSPTSSVDVLPTILSILDQELPDSLEGSVLPGFNNNRNTQKPIFSFVSKGLRENRNEKAYSISMVWGLYKLIYYKGYKDIENTYEVYNLKNDPEELYNLFEPNSLLSKTLINELNRKLGKIDHK